jgi:hypothetical protein
MITLPRVLSANGNEDATIESLKVSHNRLSSRFDYFERIEVLLIRFELFEIIIDTRKNRDVLITRSFLVRRKHFDSVRHRSPLPVFDRTRTVDISERIFGGIPCVCIQCSCFGLLRNKHACRHMYAVLGIEPSADHVFPECLKAYETFMFRHDIFTAKCEQKTQLMMSTRSLVLPGTADLYCKSTDLWVVEENLDWFLEAKTNVIDVNQNCEIHDYDENGNSSDDDDIPLMDLLPERKKQHVDPYGRYMKQFTDLCNLVSVTDDGMDKIFDEGFHNLRTNILQYQNKQKQGMKRDTTLASFPNISKVKKSRRKKPVGSPGKR